ncbi:MAG: Flp pilus assembly protein TadG [Celeribacter sp.]|jgi:Flp pilus assembly protein TadG
MKSLRILTQRATSVAGRFKRRDTGSMTVEAVLVLPTVLFGLLFVYTYFAAFQVKSMANKAAYTVSDYVSRQTDPINADFIEGLSDIYGFLTNTGNKSLRISSFTWSDSDGTGDYELQWSYAANSGEALTENDIPTVLPRLPVLTNGETVLVVEAATTWAPIFDVGLEALSFPDFVATKPRFATQVLFDDGNASTPTEEGTTDVEPDNTYDRYSGGHHGGHR